MVCHHGYLAPIVTIAGDPDPIRLPLTEWRRMGYWGKPKFSDEQWRRNLAEFFPSGELTPYIARWVIPLIFRYGC